MIRRTSFAKLLEADYKRTGFFTPVLKIVFAHLGTSLQCIPHGVFAVHHETNMVDALRVVLAVAFTAKKDCIASPPISELHFPNHNVNLIENMQRD